MLQKIKNSLALQIFIAMIIGAVLGITAGEHMLRLGFIGETFERPRHTLIDPLPGDVAFFTAEQRYKAMSKRKAKSKENAK